MEYPVGHPQYIQGKMQEKLDRDGFEVKHVIQSRDFQHTFAVLRMFNLDEAHVLKWTNFKNPLGLNRLNLDIGSGFYAIFFLAAGSSTWQLFQREKPLQDFFFRPMPYGRTQLSCLLGGGAVVTGGTKTFEQHKGRIVFDAAYFLGMDGCEGTVM